MRTTELHLTCAQSRAIVYGFARHKTECFILDSNETESALQADRYELLAGFGMKTVYQGSVHAMRTDPFMSGKWQLIMIEYGHVSNAGMILAEPAVMVTLKKGADFAVVTECREEEGCLEEFLKYVHEFSDGHTDISFPVPMFQPDTSRDDYIRQVERIRQDIIDGRYYELNYSIGFSAAYEAESDPLLFSRLNELSRAPFSAYVRQSGRDILCSSPERFLCKEGNRLLSQPIKGTAVRLEGSANEAALRQLQLNEKERAENVMIVDLVRNDLARVCKPGTIKVEELFGAYAFSSLNHLISSVSGEMREGTGFAELMQALFPMGSMTGAPKLEVMRHIAKYETGERGLYSGSIGYIDPEGDFDMNVVIRTLLIDKIRKQIGYRVGSAITYDSDPSAEYEECLLKGSRLTGLFSGV